MKSRKIRFAVMFAVVGLFASAYALSQGNEYNQGRGEAVVTVLPGHQGASSPVISKNELTAKVNGKPAEISKWEHLQDANAPIQMVVLIDDAARGSLGNQLGDVAQFIKDLPPSAEVAVAYMDNGRANFAGHLSKDHSSAARDLRMPMGQPGISGSPYFCLSDLAYHWPSQDPAARRMVVMITSGVDNYEIRYNPEDPYLQAAIHDAVRSRISVYSIFWSGRGPFGGGRYAADDGQNLLAQLTGATGGYSYWQGVGNPVSLQPYFKDLNLRLKNQYSLSVTVPLSSGPKVENLSLHATASSVKLIAPQQVFIGHPASGTQGNSQGD